MDRKKILITIDWFLPGTKSGGPVRSYANMIAHLGAYFDFYIVTRDTDYCSNEVYKSIVSNQWNAFNSYTSIYYISEDQLSRSTLKQIFNSIEFDYALVNGIYSMYFSILPVVLLKQKSKVIISARGMLNPQAFSVKPLKKKLFLTIAKGIGFYKNVEFHATNRDEANHIKAIVGQQAKIKIAPNLPRPISKKPLIMPVLNTPIRYVTISRVSIEKGTLKMIKSLKEVKNHIILDIYGPIYDQEYWNKCVKAIQTLPEHISVNYKGILESSEVLETLSKYHFFVLLSEGENFGHAILEAMSMGLPVIISDKTPWKNLENRGVGWDLNINNVDMINKVFDISSTMDSEKYSTISKNAYTFAKSFSQNPELINQNRDLFEKFKEIK